MQVRVKALVGVVALLVLGGASMQAAPAETHQMVRLASGKQIKLIGVSAGSADAGQPKPMTLKYITDRNIADRKSLAAEVDDIWDMFRVEVEKAGVTTAVISANAQGAGPDRQNHQFDFVLIKGGTGKWHCLNDEIVGVGTPDLLPNLGPPARRLQPRYLGLAGVVLGSALSTPPGAGGTGSVCGY